MAYELSKEENKTLTRIKAVPYLAETLKQIDNFVANDGQMPRENWKLVFNQIYNLPDAILVFSLFQQAFRVSRHLATRL